MKARDRFGQEILVGDRVAIIYQNGSLSKLVRGIVEKVKTTTVSGKPRQKPEVTVRAGKHGKMVCKEVRNRIVKVPEGVR